MTLYRNTFESACGGPATWDIGRPRKALLGVADRFADCGTADTAL